MYLILAVLLGLVLYRGLPALIAGKNPPVKLIVYGFSTQEEVMSQDIFPLPILGLLANDLSARAPPTLSA